MFNQWDALRKRYDGINEQLMSQSLDSKKRTELQKQASLMATILSCYDEVEQTKQLITDSQQQLESESDAELKEMFELELKELKQQLVQQEDNLEEALYPPDEISTRSAFLEIRAGAGGQEASLFVADLLKMYTYFAEKNNWKMEVVSENMTDLKGYKEVIVHIKGKGAFGALQKNPVYIAYNEFLKLKLPVVFILQQLLLLYYQRLKKLMLQLMQVIYELMYSVQVVRVVST